MSGKDGPRPNERDRSALPISGHVCADGTGWFMDCPRCHFHKNAASKEGDPCRALNRTGTVERVEFACTPPGTGPVRHHGEGPIAAVPAAPHSGNEA